MPGREDRPRTTDHGRTKLTPMPPSRLRRVLLLRARGVGGAHRRAVGVLATLGGVAGRHVGGRRAAGTTLRSGVRPIGVVAGGGSHRQEAIERRARSQRRLFEGSDMKRTLREVSPTAKAQPSRTHTNTEGENIPSR